MKRTLLAMLFGTAMLIAAPFSHATLLHFDAVLNGPSENPSNASPGTGFVLVHTDDVAHTMHVEVDFTGLVAAASAAHIHCCIAPPGNTIVAVGMPGFPGATSGTYSHDFDMTVLSSYNATFDGGTAASKEAALIAGMIAGTAYFNIHSGAFPGGEIRGFLQAVPEPGTIALLASGLVAGWVMRRRRRD